MRDNNSNNIIIIIIMRIARNYQRVAVMRIYMLYFFFTFLFFTLFPVTTTPITTTQQYETYARRASQTLEYIRMSKTTLGDESSACLVYSRTCVCKIEKV